VSRPFRHLPLRSNLQRPFWGRVPHPQVMRDCVLGLGPLFSDLLPEKGKTVASPHPRLFCVDLRIDLWSSFPISPVRNNASPPQPLLSFFGSNWRFPSLKQDLLPFFAYFPFFFTLKRFRHPYWAASFFSLRHHQLSFWSRNMCFFASSFPTPFPLTDHPSGGWFFRLPTNGCFLFSPSFLSPSGFFGNVLCGGIFLLHILGSEF